jgi:hypothetical protein
MLYRVTNLRASRDKRLRAWPANFALRKVGIVGYAKFGGNQNQDIAMLSVVPLPQNNHDVLGVYRRDELEEVTQAQLDLEEFIIQLLSIFPNREPQQVLNLSLPIEDFRVAHDTVKTLRRMLRTHPLLRARKVERDLNRLDGKKLTLEAQFEQIEKRIEQLYRKAKRIKI